MLNLKEDWMQGKLCEKGFLKEKYDENSKELIRKFTPKGIREIKEALKEIEYQKYFLKLMRQIPEDLRKATWQNIRRVLNE